MAQNNEKPAAGKGKEDADDIAARFPDPQTDARLHAGGTELPPPPQIQFTRPTLPQAPPLLREDRIPTSGSGYNQASGGGAPTGAEARGMGLAYTIGISLFASVMAGVILGWAVDKYLLGQPKTPWGLTIGSIAGITLGFVNVMRLSNRLNRETERQPLPPPRPASDEEDTK